MKKTLIWLCFMGFYTANAEAHHHEHKHEEPKAALHGHEPGKCNHKTAPETCKAEKHDHAHACEFKAVKLSAGAQKALGLETMHPQRRQLKGIRYFAGRYELSPESRRAVPSPVTGRLQLKVKPLDKVAKGQELFTITSPELVSRSREIAQLEKRLAIYRELNSANADLENQLAVKKAERAALVFNHEERDGVVTIRAMMAGVVEATPAADGSWLELGAEVVRLVRPDGLQLKVLAATSEAAKLTPGGACEVDGIKGELRLGLGDDTGMVPVYAVFPQGIAKGMVGERAQLAVMTDKSTPQARVVPNSAIVRLGLQPTVFVRDEHDKERFIALPVTIGVQNGGWTAIEGLPENDHLEVVATGAYELKLGIAEQTSGAKTAGHFHADGSFHEGNDH